MTRQWITCPESAHIEEVELETTEVGLIVVGCTRLVGTPELECPRECTRRLDRRARSGIDDRKERILVVLGQDDDPTAMITSYLEELMVRDDIHVEVALADRRPPPPSDYDCVIIGARQRFGTYARAVLDFARRNRAVLAVMPTAVFEVRVGRPRRDDGLAERLSRLFGWRPNTCASFGEIPDACRVKAFAFEVEDIITPLERVPQ